MQAYKLPYRNAAVQIANAICRDAIWDNNACNWTGLATEYENGLQKNYTRALPHDFYDGVAGVTFFLVQVYKMQPHELLLKTINGAVQQLLRQESGNNDLNGFYNGSSGVIFALQNAAAVLKDVRLQKQTDKKLEKILPHLKAEPANDIVCGLAGIILYLLCLFKKNRDKKLLVTGITLGNTLLQRANKTNKGISWNSTPAAAQNLTGFAHGTAGIATAMIELYAASGDEKFLTTAKEAFNYEDSFFNTQLNNWPDLRFANSLQLEEQQVCATAWCHGAAGIGMARLRAFEITGNTSFLKTAKLAADTTLAFLNEEKMGDYSLCHGLFGNAIFLLQFSKITGIKKYHAAVIKMADDTIEKNVSKNIPLPNGYHSIYESPCLMQGTSGMGYFFMMLSGNKVQSPLLL